MPLTTTPDRAEQVLTGQVLRRLRSNQSLSQARVAEGLNMSTQAWQKYEAGERKFTAARIAEVLAIIGVGAADYDAERARQLGRPKPEPGLRDAASEFVFDVYARARAGPQGVEVYDVGEPLRSVDMRQILGPSTGALEIAGDSMVPWAEPGELVLFDRDRYPKRGGGCVIETMAGQYYVKRYEKSDGSTLFVSELFPEERIITFPLKDLKGVYAIRLRGD